MYLYEVSKVQIDQGKNTYMVLFWGSAAPKGTFTPQKDYSVVLVEMDIVLL